MISPDLPHDIHRFLTRGDLVQAPLPLWNACPVPDTVKPRDYQERYSGSLLGVFSQLWRQTDPDFLINDRAFLHYPFILGLR